MKNQRKLWIAFIAVVVVSFAVLIYYGQDSSCKCNFNDF